MSYCRDRDATGRGAKGDSVCHHAVLVLCACVCGGGAFRQGTTRSLRQSTLQGLQSSSELGTYSPTYAREPWCLYTKVLAGAANSAAILETSPPAPRAATFSLVAVTVKAVMYA